MTQQSDHNLLFGILAVQMDFVTRDSLLNAMNAWLMRKRDSLGQLLVEQGDLSVANERLLQQVVDAHLAVHHRDIRQSLAASIRMTDLAGALRDLNDEDLRQSLADFSSPAASALNDTLIGNLSSLDGRFFIVRPHASGGLGEVSVAIDRELNREVALKRVREQLAGSPEACNRFRMEAEVTGSLEHPGIVPVYSMGSTEEGRPFYAMRFIRGETMHHVESSQVDRSAMTIFLDIGDAVRRFGTDEKFADDAAANPKADSAVTESQAQMARRYYERADRIAKDRAEQPNADSLARGDLAVTLNKLANAELQLGRPAEALEWVRQGIAVSKALAAEFPDDTDAQIQLCTWLCQAGDIQMRSGDQGRGGESYRSALTIAEPLAISQPNNEEFKRVTSVVLGRLGNIELHSGRFNEALRYYEKDLQIAQELCDAAPEDTTRQGDFVISRTKIGDVHSQAGNLNEAVVAYRKAARDSEELLAGEPNDMLQMRTTAVICIRIGDVLFKSSDVKGALETYRRGYDLSRKIADASGQDAAAQRDLAISLEHLGDAYLSLGETDNALKSFTDSHTIKSRLAIQDISAQAQNDLMVSLCKMASVHQNQKRWHAAHRIVDTRPGNV